MTEPDRCPHCERAVILWAPNRAQLILQEHRSHQQARALAEGGYVEAEGGSYGCDTGCEYARYFVYDAKGVEIAVHGEFGEPDDDTLREWAEYYGVKIAS